MTNPNVRHVPVLLTETLEFLRVQPGSTIVDCTLGLAGHSAEIARRLGPKGRLIAFDRDPEALALAKARLDEVCAELGDQAPQITLIGEAFSSIEQHVEPASLDGLLADFGVSSMQLNEAPRGFSFMADGPLDMRMDTRSGLTAEQVVNEENEGELANLIYEYGEERRSRRIARAIVRGRPVTTTAQLARIVAQAAPAMKQDRFKIHPATRTFQAIRIVVNRELDEIRDLMEAAPRLLKPSGRIALISFHSLEDRIVKDSLRDGAQKEIWNLLTKKPATASEEETERNPRSRSAKLRAAEKAVRTNRRR
ncbi:16S rRNA (cytosine(1402)-N(4))-methyltransferase RsmH [Terracidiphilus gabretensis]|jgi:16S rRNA (cytosine1402-N4)-methyltransferase|uniref:16S rRNA (cytosine(1402)-N(4))-methyltransferase RsmH n=1 Tax=Terracidiphilus gabretensis TaxID=1577687 RepID=UPI00071B3B21|nr:16S rRNA (cytosine(1402)-N(4))-methyltransferase RsmH [Terracidiphilus gabretensis]